jgi:N-acetylmuramoyl-L-alanine amidase
VLRADGYRVVVSRTRDAAVARPQPGDESDGVYTAQGAHNEVASRDVCANLAKASILIGIYMDAGGSTQNAGSITAYDAARTFSAANLRLADLVQNAVLAEMNAQGWGIPNDGVQSDATLGGPPLSSAAATYGHLLLLGPAMPGYFDTPSEMPGALIEPLFITDPYEGSIAASTQGQRLIATGLAEAVKQYFEAPTTTPTTALTPGLGT